jgi:hypothetical protein
MRRQSSIKPRDECVCRRTDTFAVNEDLGAWGIRATHTDCRKGDLMGYTPRSWPV